MWLVWSTRRTITGAVYRGRSLDVARKPEFSVEARDRSPRGVSSYAAGNGKAVNSRPSRLVFAEPWGDEVSKLRARREAGWFPRGRRQCKSLPMHHRAVNRSLLRDKLSRSSARTGPRRVNRERQRQREGQRRVAVHDRYARVCMVRATATAK